MLTPAHVELYGKIKSDNAYRAGYRVDEAMAFCERVEQRLAPLTEEHRQIVLLQAAGYTQGEMSRMLGVCLRTLTRHVLAANCAAFGEFMLLMNGVLPLHRCAALGKQFGRPKRRTV